MVTGRPTGDRDVTREWQGSPTPSMKGGELQESMSGALVLQERGTPCTLLSHLGGVGGMQGGDRGLWVI